VREVSRAPTGFTSPGVDGDRCRGPGHTSDTKPGRKCKRNDDDDRYRGYDTDKRSHSVKSEYLYTLRDTETIAEIS
jgi:hypothetical protein